MKKIFTLEILPDELLLEIYRYLHCGHILYSFTHLNTRFNHTITDYSHHVTLRRLNYQQFLYLYSNILPNIGQLIHSFTINRLQQTLFVLNFSKQINQLFPNLQKLAFDDWQNDELFTFVSTHLNQLKYLRTIIIRGLRQIGERSSLASLINDYNYLFEIIDRNRQLEKISFEPDCYSMTLLINKKSFIMHSNLVEMNISLSSSNDLICLANLIPCLRCLHVIIEEFVRVDKEIIPFQCLSHFSLDALDEYSTFDDLSSILQLIPTIEYLSLVLTTRDERLIDGEQLFTLLSSKLVHHEDVIQTVKYAVCLLTSVEYYFDVKKFSQSWKSLSMAHTINRDTMKTYILIHTLPYPSNLLNLHSTLDNKFGWKIGDHVYNSIQYLCICRVTTLREIFTILQHCRKILDLTIQIDDSNSVSSVTTNKQSIPSLPIFKRLEILSIFGLIDNWQHFKTLIIAAHNLSTLCIDIDCVMKIFNTTDDIIFFPRILHLFIDGQRSDVKFSNEHISQLATVFSHLHSLKIKYKLESLIEGEFIGAILDHFTNLTVFTINGQISDHVSSEHLAEWLMEYSSRLRQNSKQNYRIELIDNWFQVWL